MTRMEVNFWVFGNFPYEQRSILYVISLIPVTHSVKKIINDASIKGIGFT